jgi:hypothetical protein
MFDLDYYKDLIDVVITFKHCNKYDLDEILVLLPARGGLIHTVDQRAPNDDIQMIQLIYQEY